MVEPVTTSKQTTNSLCSVFTVEYYQPLFDVETSEVGLRLLQSVKPYPTSAFFTLTRSNPDLYGPFWIYSTLVFVIAVASNLSRYIALKDV